MKIILLRDVKNIGRKFEVKEVNDGFARNGLIGKGMAVPATRENLGRMKTEMDKVTKVATDRAELLASGLNKVSDIGLIFSGKANPEGHLFAAIHSKDIAKEIEIKAGIIIQPAWLEPKTLKTVGEHEMILNIDGHRSKFMVKVIAD